MPVINAAANDAVYTHIVKKIFRKHLNNDLN